MISLHMVGDKVIFYSYKIECRTPTFEEKDWEKFYGRLGVYRIESDGLYADNDTELANIEVGLKELAYIYTITDISPTEEQIDKAKEIEGKTGSPKVALDYILNEIVPERMVKERELVNLRVRIEKLEERNNMQSSKD